LAGFAVSTLVETNRVAALKSPRSWGKLIGAGSNAVGLVAGLAALANGRESEAVAIDRATRSLAVIFVGPPSRCARPPREAASVLLEALR
jgi:hypothetical protein